MLDKFAEELKLSREKKGLSLQQMALKTKIDPKFLEVMEEGDFSFLPELYVKAFLKNYARVVDLDEETTIQKYEAAKSGRTFEEVEPLISESTQKTEKGKNIPKDIKRTSTPVSTHLKEPGSADKQKYIFGAIALIILIIAVIYYFSSKPSTDIIVTEKPLDEIVQENQQRYLEEEKNPDFNNENTGVVSDSLNLNIVSSETSWVKIIYDDRSTGEFILFPQSQKTVKTADNFKVTFGNSKGIKLKLNGTDLAFEPGKRTVARILIDSTGLRFINIESGVQQ